MSRLKTFIGVPDAMSSEEKVSIAEANMNKLSSVKYIRLEELSKRLGAKS